MKQLTPLYDKSKASRVRYYCDTCLIGVKNSMLPHEKNYLWFGQRGEGEHGKK